MLTDRLIELLEARGLDPEVLVRHGVAGCPERGPLWIAIPFREADVLALLGQPARGADMAAGVAAKSVTFRREALPKSKLGEARYLLSGSNVLASSVTVACPTRVSST